MLDSDLILVLAVLALFVVVVGGVVFGSFVSARNYLRSKPSPQEVQWLPTAPVGVAKVQTIKKALAFRRTWWPGCGEVRLGTFTFDVLTEQGRHFPAATDMYVRFRGSGLPVKGLASKPGRPAPTFGAGDLAPVKYNPSHIARSGVDDPARVWIIDFEDPEAQRVLRSLTERGLL